MVVTPREGEKAKGGEPYGQGERATEHGCAFGPVPFSSQAKRLVLPMRRLATKYLYIQLTILLLFVVILTS